MNLHHGFAASWEQVRPLLLDPVRVLFVCIGNVCRSPLAEVMLRKMASDAGVAAEVSSAGTWAEVRQGLYGRHRCVRAGARTRRHRSRQPHAQSRHRRRSGHPRVARPRSERRLGAHVGSLADGANHPRPVERGMVRKLEENLFAPLGYNPGRSEISDQVGGS